jgi:hypothetical protein
MILLEFAIRYNWAYMPIANQLVKKAIMLLTIR